jgi:hypothetical protein
MKTIPTELFYQHHYNSTLLPGPLQKVFQDSFDIKVLSGAFCQNVLLQYPSWTVPAILLLHQNYFGFTILVYQQLFKTILVVLFQDIKIMP